MITFEVEILHILREVQGMLNGIDTHERKAHAKVVNRKASRLKWMALDRGLNKLGYTLEQGKEYALDVLGVSVYNDTKEGLSKSVQEQLELVRKGELSTVQ